MNGAQALHPHPRRPRRRRLLHQPRHLGDALRGRPRRRARDAGVLAPLRGGGHRRGRRLRPRWPGARRPRCCTSGPASATASPTCTTPGGPARPVVNIVGDHATYHRPLRRAAPVGHRAPRRRRSRAGTARPPGPTTGRRRRRRRGRRARAARAAWPPWSSRPTCRGRRRRPGPARRGRAAGRRPVPADTVEEVGARPCARASRPRSSSADARSGRGALHAASRVAARHRGQAARRDLPGPPRARRGRPGGRAAGLPGRVGPGPAGGRPPPGAGRRRRPGVLLRLPRPGRATWSRRAAPCTPWPGPATTRRGALRPWPRRWAPPPDARRPGAVGPARAPDGPAHRESLAAGRRRRCSPRAPSWSTRGTRRASSSPAPRPAAPRHDWLCLTGGAIGQGLPVATGAAVAAPDRPVLSLEADGSAMYTLQSLWTQAREGLDVTTSCSSNRILRHLEHGAAPGRRRRRRRRGPGGCSTSPIPTSTSCDLARGMGVPGTARGDRRGPRGGTGSRLRRAGAVAHRGAALGRSGAARAREYQRMHNGINQRTTNRDLRP